MIAGLRLGRLAILAVILWLALLLYTSTVLVSVHKTSRNTVQSEKAGAEEEMAIQSRNLDGTDLRNRFDRALVDLKLLRKQNEELKSLLHPRNITSSKSGHLLSPLSIDDIILNREQQTIRRSVENGLIELWYSAISKFRTLKRQFQSKSVESDAVKKVLDELTDQHRTVLADALKLSSVNGADERRHVLLWNLTQVVQNRINYLQNPSDCRQTRKLVCQLNKGCGFGCQLHHVTYCLLVAYGTERTLILDSRGWRYSQRGWNSIFLPVSRNCLNITDEVAESWRGEDVQSNVRVISLPIIDGLRSPPPYLPLSFPEEFADKLLALHGDPPVWWIGQFVWYLMRYQTDFQKYLDSMSNRLQFASPCVGVHVRRTDKVGSEAAFHALEEYMQYVEAWFRVQAIKNGTVTSAEFDSMTKRVYLATDEPTLHAQARKSYPSYTFIGDPQVANTAQLSSRYTDSSLRGVVADIHFLSRCDYLVCTFSSQVCRVAYELMQVLRGDAASRFHSLDDIYYFGGQHGHEQIAIFPHKAASTKEIDLEVGDVVGIAGNHWDGYSKGKNMRTNQIGLYPSYKTKERWRIVKFPNYPKADIQV